MSAPKGYSSQEKDDRLRAECATIEPVRELQHGMSVISHEFVQLITTDAAEAGSTDHSIVATAHSAKKGDVIRITSGTYSGRDVRVSDTSANLITLAETLDSAVAAAVTFQILRHRYPTVDAAGAIAISGGSFTSGPIQYVLDGVDTEVEEDTGTPANNRPLPVKLMGTTGPINITAGDLNVQLSDQGANFDITRVGDGTHYQSFTAANEAKVSVTQPLPAGTNAIGKLSANSGVDIGDVTVDNAAGAAAVNIQDGGNSITVDGTVAATQSGVWNITNVSGTVSLPTGAATSANQTNKTQYTHITDGTDDALVTAAGELNVLATAQPGVDIGDVTINNAAGASAVNIQDGGNSITVDGTVTANAGTGNFTVTQATGTNLHTVVDSGSITVTQATGTNLHTVVDSGTIAATQSGTWNITNISGTVSLPTGAATETTLSALNAKFNSLGQKTMANSAPVVIASDQTVIPVSDNGGSLTVDGTVAATQSGTWSVTSTDAGFATSGFVRNDYSSVNVTTGAYVQLIASTTAAAKEVEIFDSSGQTLKLAVGAAASEVDQFLIFPGGNGRVRLAIPAASRISIRAVSATASVGEIDINLYG